jgi:superfamily II DNA or RNA helicase
MILRPYQEEAADAALARFAAGEQRTALVLATGAGKTVIFAELIRRWVQRVPGKVLVLAHRAELLFQAAEKIRLCAPSLRVGLVKAGINQTWADVMVASQQTLQRSDRLARIPDVSLVVVDECHRAAGKTYQKVLTELGCLRPDGPRVLGCTATFSREDSKRLTDFFQSVAYSRDILDLIEDGYLVSPKFKRVLVEGLDLSAIRSSRLAEGSDLAAGELDEAMERAGAAGVVAAAYRKHAADRPAFVFTPTVHSGQLVRDAFRAEGFTCELLSGTTPAGERTAIMRRYNAGQLQALVNCAILTEGTDAPRTACVVMARPTLSKILFRQVVGRGLRLFCPVEADPLHEAPCPQCKTDCLVLDLVGATGRNDLRTLNDVVDVPVQVEEGELITDAVKRTRREQAEIIGDALVSGSLATVDTDPWEVERRAKLTARERALEDVPQDETNLRQILAEDDEVEPPEAKERYRHVDERRGWFLRSPRGSWFIPLQPNRSQTGFVAVIPTGDEHVVAVCLPGVRWQEHATPLETAERAAQVALDLALELLPRAEQRSQIDPDARWRRRPVTRNQLSFLEALGGDQDVNYQGQAADKITAAKLGSSVDSFSRTVASSLATVLA